MMRRNVVAVGAMFLMGMSAHALAGPNCCPSQAKARTAAAEKKAAKSAAAKCGDKLAECPSYEQANKLLAQWEQVPARLVSMTAEDREARRQAGSRMAAHPVGGLIHPTLEFLHSSLATAVELDEACAAKCDKAGTPSCPMPAATKARVKDSVALVSKASELMTVAHASLASDVQGQKSACADGKEKVSLVSADGASCPTKAKPAAAEAKSGCSKPEARLVAAEGSDCPTKAKPAAAEAKSGCSKPEARLVAAEGSDCPTKAKPAAAEAKSGCSKPQATLAAGTASGCAKPATVAKSGCGSASEKPLIARAKAVAAEGEALVAKWERVEATFGRMDESTRRAARQACVDGIANCPAGALMPQTLATVQELLTAATKLSAECREACAKDDSKCSPEMKEICEARATIISATLSVLDKTATLARPDRQVASAR